MSYFKKGDVVRYKGSQIYNMPCNSHGDPDPAKEFIVSDYEFDPLITESPELGMVRLKGYGGGCFAFRLELVKEAKNPECNFAWGVFLANGQLEKVFKTREEARIYKSKWLPMTIKKIKYEIV